MRRVPYRRRWAAQASSSRQRISSTLPSSPVLWPSTTGFGTASSPASAAAPPISPTSASSSVSRRCWQTRKRPPDAHGAPRKMKLAFIVQRYGAEVLGGSEHLCSLVAERLAPRHEIDVLTTCARDYVTWKNEYPEGSDRIRGVTVRRFATARTRDLDAFNRYSEWIYTHPHSRADELEWLKQQGPWSPALIDYLRAHQQQYDALIFFTYLYAPTVLGLEVNPGKSVL